MNILCACEESQAVTIELRRLGHRAFSCDIQECSGGHPEWHIQGDVLPLLNGRCEFVTMDGKSHKQPERWDMIIAFPPCTKTSNAGARHLYKGGLLNIPRYYDGLCGKALFLAIYAADCDKVIIENPTPSKVFDYPEPTQAIQPFQFGHPFTKKLCYGNVAFYHLCLQTLWNQNVHGVQVVVILAITVINTVECSQRTERKTEVKPFLA